MYCSILFTNSNWFALPDNRDGDADAPMSSSHPEPMDEISLSGIIEGSNDEVVVGEDEELAETKVSSSGMSCSNSNASDQCFRNGFVNSVELNQQTWKLFLLFWVKTFCMCDILYQLMYDNIFLYCNVIWYLLHVHKIIIIHNIKKMYRVKNFVSEKFGIQKKSLLHNKKLVTLNSRYERNLVSLLHALQFWLLRKVPLS